MHVVAGSVGSRGGGRLLHDRDDLSSSLLHLGEEWAVQELVVVDYGSHVLALDGGVVGVWVLSG